MDARLILKFLEQNREHLRCLKLDSPETSELLALTGQRRELVEKRVALANFIGALWKQYFPAIVATQSKRVHVARSPADRGGRGLNVSAHHDRG